MKKNMPLLISLIFAVIICSCGTTSFYVPVMKPAEVNLLAFKAIAIGEFQDDVTWRWSPFRGALAQDVTDEITRALLETKRFDVLDRRNFDLILKEQGLHSSNLGGIKLEKASCLLTGRVSQLKYDEQMNTVEVKREGKPPAMKNIRTGVVRMEVVLQITDLTNGKIVWNQRLRAQTTSSREAMNTEPPKIDEDILRTDAQAIIVGDFMQRIMPVEEQVSVTLLTDDDLEEMEKGIKRAKRGGWDDAISIFKDATEKYTLNENVHKAWFNLGVAYQYSYDFRRAEECFKNALTIKDKTLYKHQLENCYEMEKEYLEVLKQEQEAK